MKQIYFVLTDTGTVLSRIIKLFMKDEYSHVSISLDRNLMQMYSFGRLNPYNPFHGGFIHEYINRGTFKRFHETKAKIIVLDINDEQYENLKHNISNIKKNRKNLKFNILGLFAIYFNIKIRRTNYFYCAEFVKYITENSGINLNLPDLIRPEDFKEINGGQLRYKGLLKEYYSYFKNKKRLLTFQNECSTM